MRKFLFVLIAGFLLTSVSHAQKIGYIDSNFILSKMPAFNKVQQEMDKYAAGWQKEVETLQQESDKLKQDYKAEEVLLTEQMKKKRQAEITKKDNELRDYQRKVFGYEGMMFKRRQELMRPVQDEVFEAVEKVSKSKGVQMMFDKSGDLVMIYTNPVHDYTEYVLEELGLASDKKNQPGQTPADSIVDDPANLPDVGAEEQQESQPAVKANKKKPNN
ncbi:OmpH family outer membrane protein [Pontibacter diazotrophicus]|uniref:OmpH family outer membrane protein n=1 Tax=Pontibacter diazotrophicus TaxID=1400979 RepID=A0A3D8L9P6_9BACT|nr:OmpH family outer membrane protein [Pontibacter diazotrophicus]RDV14120.1 OmpH family outer membrane protein [Pontibacter diazotrophicus]